MDVSTRSSKTYAVVSLICLNVNVNNLVGNLRKFHIGKKSTLNCLNFMLFGFQNYISLHFWDANLLFGGRYPAPINSPLVTILIFGEKNTV